MKNKFLLYTAVVMLSFSQVMAQAPGNHLRDSLEKSALAELVSYISADTLDIKLEETEKNSINHTGEQHQLVAATARGAGIETPSAGSWDKFLPTVYNKEATIGSPFLLFLYVPGLVVNDSYTIVHKPDYRYNYDKMSGNLVLIRNGDSPIAVNKSQVRMFCLKTDKGGFIFMRVPLINDGEFFQVIYEGSKYSVYKLYKNKFVKSDQTTNGYTANGKNYDEYEDIVTYYLLDENKEVSHIFELRKKSVKTVFGSVNPAAEKYLTDHKNEDITENLVAGLTAELNK